MQRPLGLQPKRKERSAEGQPRSPWWRWLLSCSCTTLCDLGANLKKISRPRDDRISHMRILIRTWLPLTHCVAVTVRGCTEVYTICPLYVYACTYSIGVLRGNLRPRRASTNFMVGNEVISVRPHGSLVASPARRAS